MNLPLSPVFFDWKRGSSRETKESGKLPDPRLWIWTTFIQHQPVVYINGKNKPVYFLHFDIVFQHLCGYVKCIFPLIQPARSVYVKYSDFWLTHSKYLPELNCVIELVSLEMCWKFNSNSTTHSLVLELMWSVQRVGSGSSVGKPG